MKKLKFNQFNPTPSEIENIKAKNKNLPLTEQICYKCGHKYLMVGWCGNNLNNINTSGNWDNVDVDDVQENGDIIPPHPCCDMECSYS